MKKSIYLILHNIRSAENVGSIFRTADAVGVNKIYLTGYTPRPLDRFGRPVGKITKTALGAEKSLAWQYEKNISSLIKKLQKKGVKIVAVEQDKKSLDYRKFKLKSDTALIFGNEVNGIDQKTLNLCDQIIEIPMCGKKESLNVSVAVGVVLFRILD